MEKKKILIRVDVDADRNIIKINEELNLNHQEAYLEVVDSLKQRMGLDALNKCSWHFKDRSFENLTDLSDYFIHENRKDLEDMIEDMPEVTDADDLIDLLKAVKNVLKSTMKVINKVLKSYEEAQNGSRGLSRDDD